MNKRFVKKIKNDIIYYSIVVLISLLRALNRRASILLMRGIGRLAWHLALYERKKSLKHLTGAFGKELSKKEIIQLSKGVFDNIAVCVADAVRLPNLVSQGLDRIVTVENFEYLTDAVAEGNGVLLQTGHFSNWELMGTWLVQKGIPLRVIAKRSYDPRLDAIIVGYRNKAGYSNTARGNALKTMVDGLKNGCVYGMLFDLDTKVKGVFVDFFGKPAHTAVIPAMMAVQHDIPIVPVFIRLNDDYTYTIECQPPLSLQRTDEPYADAQVNTQRCSDVYESMIRRYPRQWIWMHSRWKKQPTRTAA
ncbi:lysophospholipid acyltransferase family protein [Desulfoluna spongiiphila]|uniref:KDO2-lipid IV(A) lauroyltransferase n=1 Tax=Desulfoluna spongiiphila TaxID=419481 RepID=A0A1G5DFB1_9BACT|nr:lysophospholipid acyltransferase family protein [Desulfoluna spongiiphila]SCY13559.1 KDO2-lipid IV(A) lauroyltransferase [Desulfoluna spongiiphila]